MRGAVDDASEKERPSAKLKATSRVVGQDKENVAQHGESITSSGTTQTTATTTRIPPIVMLNTWNSPEQWGTRQTWFGNKKQAVVVNNRVGEPVSGKRKQESRRAKGERWKWLAPRLCLEFLHWCHQIVRRRGLAQKGKLASSQKKKGEDGIGAMGVQELVDTALQAQTLEERRTSLIQLSKHPYCQVSEHWKKLCHLLLSHACVQPCRFFLLLLCACVCV